MNERERLVELIEKARAAMKKEELSCDLARNFFFAEFLLNNGVTIQKRGRWEEYVNIKGVVRCSECNDTYIYREWVDEGKWYYCPNCGAKMDLEDSDG